MGKRTVSILLVALLGGIAGFAGLMAAEATAARYTVTQCGWHVGMDASWADTSADKFTRSSYCQAPASADPFENVHMTSQTRPSADTVGGTRFARWRWTAPSGTGIVTVQGQRWQWLNDGFQHRIGGVGPGGTFRPFAEYSSTDSVKRDFRSSFAPFAEALESRLLCAKADDKICSTRTNSVAGIRGLRLTLDDSHKPGVSYTGGLTGDGWLRGPQSLQFGVLDNGSGLRYSQTVVDDTVRATSEHPCDKAYIAGQWHATRMRPCNNAVSGTHVVQTATLNDGTHRIRQCATDFATNQSCTADDLIRVDNNSPAAPRELSVNGGDAWRRENSFRIEWREPDQGAAAPIAGFIHRMTGPGVQPQDVGVAGRGSLDGIEVPGPGEYEMSVWLIDHAFNFDPNSRATVKLRFDDVPPEAYFERVSEQQENLLLVRATDAHSGIAGGAIRFRRQGTTEWQQLDTELGADEDGPTIRSTFPRSALEPGVYEFEVTATDAAGNQVTTGKRKDGSPMTIEIPVPPPPPPVPEPPVKGATTLTARLARHAERSLSLRVPHGETTRIEGSLTGSGGRPLAQRTVEILVRPVPGASVEPTRIEAITDGEGYFGGTIPRGPSRNVFVRFAETGNLKESAVGPLQVRVAGAVSFRARPGRVPVGRKVVFSGAVDMRGVARTAPSSVVAIQYYERSSGRWRPVLVARTDRYGKFRKGYRFRYLTRPTRIRLRARLLPPAGFPFESSASRGRVVVVNGLRAGRR